MAKYDEQYHTNERNHYYQEQDREASAARSDDEWRLPIFGFGLMDVAHWVGCWLGERNFHKRMREEEARKQLEAERDADK